RSTSARRSDEQGQADSDAEDRHPGGDARGVRPLRRYPLRRRAPLLLASGPLGLVARGGSPLRCGGRGHHPCTGGGVVSAAHEARYERAMNTIHDAACKRAIDLEDQLREAKRQIAERDEMIRELQE